MIKASDLIKTQQDKNNIKYKTFDKIFKLVEKKISLTSLGNYYYTEYELPHFLIGYPTYSINDCQEYIKTKLINNGFEVIFYDPNLLVISWFPK